MRSGSELYNSLWNWTIRYERRNAITEALRSQQGSHPAGNETIFDKDPNQMTKAERDRAWKWLRRHRKARVIKCIISEAI